MGDFHHIGIDHKLFKKRFFKRIVGLDWLGKGYKGPAGIEPSSVGASNSFFTAQIWSNVFR